MTECTETYEGVYKLDNTPIKFKICKGTNRGDVPVFNITFSDSDPQILIKLKNVFGVERFFLNRGGVHSLVVDINENSFEQLKDIIKNRLIQSGLTSTDPDYNIMNYRGQWMSATVGDDAMTEYENSKAGAANPRSWLFQRFNLKTVGGTHRKPTKRRRNRRGNRKTKKN
jgi:hypothetical protein